MGFVCFLRTALIFAFWALDHTQLVFPNVFFFLTTTSRNDTIFLFPIAYHVAMMDLRMFNNCISADHGSPLSSPVPWDPSMEDAVEELIFCRRPTALSLARAFPQERRPGYKVVPVRGALPETPLWKVVVPGLKVALNVCLGIFLSRGWNEFPPGLC